MKIAVLLSGGVDSSVALRLLKDEGHDLTAFYLKIWLQDEFSFLGECPWEEDLKYARGVCEQLNVSLEVIPLQTEYWDNVVSYTIDEIKEGRTFSRDYGQDQSKIICNETAVKIMGLKNPVGEIVNLWGYDRQIIGVTKDFNFESLHEEVKPSFFLLSPLNNSQIIVKINAGTENGTIPKLEKLYQKYNPGFLLDYKYLDQDYQAQYVAEKRVSNLSRNFAWLAILISCLGLFGLAAFSAERRIKEIGLRKINGASSLSIVCLLSTDFIKIILLSILIALPISYLITKSWLDSFAYKTLLSWWIFVLAGCAALFIAIVTVSWQSWKAAKSNPVEALRFE